MRTLPPSILALFLAAACAEQPIPSPPERSCSVAPSADGAATIRCPDGTEATVEPAVAASCEASRLDPTHVVIRCPDGSAIVLTDGAPGAQGDPGDGPGPDGRPGAPGGDGEAGATGSSCRVRELPAGFYQVTCQDGSAVVLSDGSRGSSCGITPIGGDAYLLRCADGTEVLLRGATGQLRGTVLRAGASDQSGTLVELEGTAYSSTTDASGGFTLTAPQGVYALVASAPGYVAARVPNVISWEGGSYDVEPLELHLGTLVLPGLDWMPVNVAADGAYVAALRPGELAIVHTPTLRVERLRSDAGYYWLRDHPARLLADGGLVWSEHAEGSELLHLWDGQPRVETLLRNRLPNSSVLWMVVWGVSPGEGQIHYLAGASWSVNELHVWSRAAGTDTLVDPQCYREPSWTATGLLAFVAQPQPDRWALRTWDPGTGVATTWLDLTSGGIHATSSAGVLAVAGVSGLTLLDPAAGTTTLVSAAWDGTGPIEFSPDGRWLRFFEPIPDRSSKGSLVVFEVATATRLEVGEPGRTSFSWNGAPRSSPDGRFVVYADWPPGSENGTVRVRDLDLGSDDLVGRWRAGYAGTLFQPTFTADSAFLVYVEPDPVGAGTLAVFDVRSRTRASLGVNVDRIALAPTRSRVAFVEGANSGSGGREEAGRLSEVDLASGVTTFLAAEAAGARYAPDSAALFALAEVDPVSQIGSVARWDLATGARVELGTGDLDGRLFELQFSADPARFVHQGYLEQATFWDLAAGTSVPLEAGWAHVAGNVAVYTSQARWGGATGDLPAGLYVAELP